MLHLNKGFSINWAKPEITRRTGPGVQDEQPRKGLVAIILAIKSSRGESIVFHYPPETQQAVPRSRTPVNHETESESELDDEFPFLISKQEHFDHRPDGHLPTIPERESNLEGGQDDWTPAWRKILDLDSSLLADILTPQKTDAKFEMWIDDLLFLGSPVHLRSDGAWLNKPLAIGTGSRSTSAIEAEVKNVHRFAQPIEKSEFSPEAGGMRTDGDIPCPMTTFHLVFALDTGVDEHYHRHVTELFEHVVRQLTSALTSEQAQCSYVWTQCEMIRAIKRRGELNHANIATLWHEIISDCELARIIQQTYDAISQDEIAHLVINDRLNLSLVLPKKITTDVIPIDPEQDHPFLNNALSFGMNLTAADPLILPHYALILLGEPGRLVKSLPSAVTPQMEEFLRAIDPRKDFYGLAELMRISIDDVLVLARDLLRWRCALPIPPLHERNIYMPSPTVNNSHFERQITLFSRAFPSLPPLPSFLADMSHKAVPYSSFIPEINQLDTYMDALAWLMKERWLIQVRTYAWVKIRGEIKAAVVRDRIEEQDDDPWLSSEREVMHDEMFEDTIISDPYNANPQEQLWLDKLATFHPVADATLFRHVCKYLNGKHAIEKVIVREGVDPRALRRLLEAFDEDLIKSYTW